MDRRASPDQGVAVRLGRLEVGQRTQGQRVPAGRDDPCGGSAESTVAPRERFGEPVDRFEAAPGRTISVYRGALAGR
jgi:hypothetical protein